MGKVAERHPGWEAVTLADGYLNDVGEFRIWINLGDSRPTDLREVVLVRKGTINVWLWTDDLEPVDDAYRESMAFADTTWDVHWECSECEHRVDNEKELDTDNPVYECGDDGERYSREDSQDGVSNRCPGCGKWGTKVAAGSCPKCGHGEMVVHREEVM